MRDAMTAEEMRLECLKLAHDWCKMRFREGFSGIAIYDVTAKAEEFYQFCMNAPADRSPEGGNHEDGFHAEHESAVPQAGAHS